jgi:hypothetical protein
MDLIGHSLEHVLQELPGRLPVSSCNELSDGELGRPVDTHEEKKLSLGRLHLGDVDVDRASGSPPVREPLARANRIPLELLPTWLVALDIRQARDAMPLQAPMQRRSGQVRDRGLQSIKAIIQRQ